MPIIYWSVIFLYHFAFHETTSQLLHENCLYKIVQIRDFFQLYLNPSIQFQIFCAMLNIIECQMTNKLISDSFIRCLIAGTANKASILRKAIKCLEWNFLNSKNCVKILICILLNSIHARTRNFYTRKKIRKKRSATTMVKFVLVLACIGEILNIRIILIQRPFKETC